MPKKEVENKGIDIKLTATEKEILKLLSDENLTIVQTAIRRQTSVQAVYKILSKLKKKGMINRLNEKVEKNRTTFQPTNQIRLHGQEFNIKIIYKDKRYMDLYKKSNTIIIDGNTIRLYRDSIEIYSGHPFYAETPQKATARSFIYWNKLFTRIEHDLKIIIIKHRVQNIKLVNHHYSETNNELAEETEKKGYKISIYTEEDAKLWFRIDNSFNLHEAETLHPETAKEDMENIKPFFNDMRKNKPPNMSDLMRILQISLKINKETAAGLNTVVQLIKTQMTPPQPNTPKETPTYFG